MFFFVLCLFCVCFGCAFGGGLFFFFVNLAMLKANGTYNSFLKATNDKLEEPKLKHVRSLLSYFCFSALSFQIFYL